MRMRVLTATSPWRPPGQDVGTWVETRLPGGWFARGRMAVQGRRVVVAELRLVPGGAATPPGGITHKVVRDVPLGSFGPYFQAVSSFAHNVPIGGLREHFQATVGAALPRLAGLLPPRPRPRRAAGRDDRFYAELARDYLAALARGSRSPVKDLAAARSAPASRIRDMVHEARERGLLSPSEPGVRGGRLLPRGLALLTPARGTTRPRASRRNTR